MVQFGPNYLGMMTHQYLLYFNHLKCNASQAYLLKQLSLDQKAMLALMKNNSYTDESLEEYHKASFQIARSVSDWLIIFSLIG